MTTRAISITNMGFGLAALCFTGAGSILEYLGWKWFFFLTSCCLFFQSILLGIFIPHWKLQKRNKKEINSHHTISNSSQKNTTKNDEKNVNNNDDNTDTPTDNKNDIEIFGEPILVHQTDYGTSVNDDEKEVKYITISYHSITSMYQATHI